MDATSKAGGATVWAATRPRSAAEVADAISRSFMISPFRVAHATVLVPAHLQRSQNTRWRRPFRRSTRLGSHGVELLQQAYLRLLSNVNNNLRQGRAPASRNRSSLLPTEPEYIR